VSDLLAEATAELYAVDPEEFTQRRAELSFQAREAGQPGIAKQIAALRKPTRSAWVLNRLARTRPEAPRRLAELAAELNAGGDGARIRELTQARSRLIDELTRQALATAGVPSPPSALREDVVATLGAALADPEVAANLAAGTLVRAAHWAGFGVMPLLEPQPRPEPSLQPQPSPSRSPQPSLEPQPSPEPSPEPRRKPSKPEPKPHISERAVAQATEAAESAAQAERELEEEVRHLEAELEQARQRLAVARREAYRAESRRRRAAAELGRNQE
jgi:hypothetical protein